MDEQMTLACGGRASGSLPLPGPETGRGRALHLLREPGGRRDRRRSDRCRRWGRLGVDVRGEGRGQRSSLTSVTVTVTACEPVLVPSLASTATSQTWLYRMKLRSVTISPAGRSVTLSSTPLPATFAKYQSSP